MRFGNPESLCWTTYQCLIFASIQTPQCSVASPYHVSLKNTCFQNNMCAEATLGEFAISLVLVILCEPVKVESESRNFSGTDGNKNNHSCSNILAKPKLIHVRT